MAQAKVRKATTTVNTKPVEEVVEVKEIEVVEEVASAPVKEVVKERRKFAPTDLIQCTNIFSGSVMMIGKKSGIVYSWEELGQTEDVEYQDVMAEILKKSSSYIYEPILIIEDKELLEQRSDLKAFYNKMYSPSELKNVLKMSSAEVMRSTIMNLPKGVKESIKNLAATMIQEGSLDSVKKIKIIDEIFGTKLMLQTELFLK